MQFSGWKRPVFYSGLAILLLFSIAVVAAPVNADPNTSSSAQRLPTRDKPTATKKPSRPSQPDPTSTPVPEPTLPPTNTPMPTATLPPTATPTPTPTPTPTSIALAGLGPAVRCADLPLAGWIGVKLGQLDSGTQNLSRDNPEAHYTLDIPGHFRISSTGSYLDLITSHFPQVPGQPSALEIEVNGRLISAIALTEENAFENRIQIDLPAGVLNAGPNSIVIRLQTGATCDDPGAILTVVIGEDSAIHLGYQKTSYPVDLADYPIPFAEKSLCSIPVTIVLPDQPAADDVAAAMTIAAGLGQRTGGQIGLQAILADTFNPTTHGDHHLIVIGRPDNHSLFDELRPSSAVTRVNLQAGEGFLEERVSPWNESRTLLVISGLDGQGIAKASQVLNLENRPSRVRGASAKVDSIRLPDVEPGSSPPPDMTLASLGHKEETIYGARPQTLSFDFTLPPGWQLTGSSAFVLSFSHSNILDPQKSVIDMRLNDRPIGSTFLDDSNASEGELTVPLPQRVLRAGTNRLEIGIEMNLPGADEADQCRLLDDERLWTVIDGKSQILVPYAIIDFRPDLGHFPYPFGQDSGLSQTLFVLPDPPNESMIDDLIQLGIRLGNATKTDYLAAHVAYASGTAQDAWHDYQLVLVGRPTANAVMSELNAYLPQPFVKGSDDLEPAATEALAAQLDTGREVGLLQMTNSPWNEQLALLAITGTTEKGVHLATVALLQPVHRLKGNLAVVDQVSEEADQITAYSVDTRPSPSPDQSPTGDNGANTEAPTEDTAPTIDKTLLASRWWK